MKISVLVQLDFFFFFWLTKFFFVLFSFSSAGPVKTDASQKGTGSSQSQGYVIIQYFWLMMESFLSEIEIFNIGFLSSFGRFDVDR